MTNTLYSCIKPVLVNGRNYTYGDIISEYEYSLLSTFYKKNFTLNSSYIDNNIDVVKLATDSAMNYLDNMIKSVDSGIGSILSNDNNFGGFGGGDGGGGGATGDF